MGQWKKREDGLRARRYILHPVVLLGLAIGSSKSFFENHGIETLDFWQQVLLEGESKPDHSVPDSPNMLASELNIISYLFDLSRNDPKQVPFARKEKAYNQTVSKPTSVHQ